MSRNLKALGLALAAVLAMSALAVSSASAAEFHSGESHTIITGAQSGASVDTFSTTAGTVHCSTATYEGTSNASTTTEIDIEPTYSGCQATPFGGATVHMNGCKYRITNTGEIHIVCPAGQSIKVTAPFCTITIHPQTMNHIHITWHTKSGKKRITGTITVSSITYTQTSGCTHGSGTFSNGVYAGEAEMSGENTEGKATDIWFE